jgi:hypothetical protein
MERFISLLKKELLGEISEAEREALLALTKTNTEFEGIYRQLCSPNTRLGKAEALKEAAEAYERHRVKMKRMNLLK